MVDQARLKWLWRGCGSVSFGEDERFCCLDANLHTAHLQLYLEVLPEDKNQWISKTKELRAQYEKIKEMVRAPPPGHIPPHDDKCDCKDDK